MKTKSIAVLTLATVFLTTATFAAADAVMCPTAADIQKATNLQKTVGGWGAELGSNAAVLMQGATSQSSAQTMLNATTAPYTVAAQQISITPYYTMDFCFYAPYNNLFSGKSVMWATSSIPGLQLNAMSLLKQQVKQ